MSFRISCKSDPNLFISIRDGKVVLAPSNSCDETQQWVKETFCCKVVDIEGVSCYALINEATNYAIRCSNQDQAVSLVPYIKGVVDLSSMWSEALDSDHVGYKSIRMGSNIKLCFDAKGAANNIVNVVLSTRTRQSGQWWKIEEYCKFCTKIKTPAQELKGPTYRVLCNSNQSLSVAVRQGKIVLVQNNPNDDYQKWYKDGRHGSKVKDMHDNPAFSLINKATREAIKLVDGEKGIIQPAPYNPDNPDQSFLWGMTIDGTVIRGLRNVIVRKPNFDNERLFNVSGGAAKDGAEIITTEWLASPNQYWKMLETN